MKFRFLLSILCLAATLGFTASAASKLDITSVSPSSGPVGEQLAIVVTGSSRFNQLLPVQVIFRQVASSTMIMAESATWSPTGTIAISHQFAKADPLGYYRMEVYQDGDLVCSKDKAFTLKNSALKSADLTSTIGGTEQVISVTPNTAKQGESINLTVTTSNIDFAQASDARISLIRDGKAVNCLDPTNIVNDKLLTCSYYVSKDAEIGSYGIGVFSDGKVIAEKPGAFEITSGSIPRITTVSPGSFELGQELVVRVTAEHVNFYQASPVQVSFTQASGTVLTDDRFVVLDAASILVYRQLKSSDPIGDYDVRLTGADGLNLKEQGVLKIDQPHGSPRIITLSDYTAFQGSEINTTITTQGVKLTSPIITGVKLSNGDTVIDVTNFTVNSSSEIELNYNFSPDAPVGFYDIKLMKGATVAASRESVLYLRKENSPSIVSVTPNTAYPEQNLSIYITAEHVDFENAPNLEVSFSQGSSVVNIPKEGVIPVNSNLLEVNHTFGNDVKLGSYKLSIMGDYDIHFENALELSNCENCPIDPHNFDIVLTEAISYANGNLYLKLVGQDTTVTLAIAPSTVSTRLIELAVQGNPTVSSILSQGGYDVELWKGNTSLTDLISGILVDGTVGTGDVQRAGVLFCPNPTEGIITLDERVQGLSLYNMMGKELLTTTDPNGQLDLWGLTKGVYLLRLRVNGEMVVEKLIIE